jgi:hypothetical protein
MKTITHLKSPSRRQFPSLALLLAAVTLLAFAPQPVRAGPSYPFHARFITEFEMVVEYPYVHYRVNCEGRATYMGPTTAVSTDQMVSMLDRSATATYTLTSNSAGVREDTLILAMTFQVTDVPNGITFTGNYTVAGGTGRFAAATGSGVVAGSAHLAGPSNIGFGSVSLSGGISFGPGE